MLRTVSLTLVLLLVPVAPAAAATLNIEATSGIEGKLTYAAAPGEVNRLEIHIVEPPGVVGQPSEATTTITDRGATFTVPDPAKLPRYMSCIAPDVHTVVCRGRSFPRDITVDLGDGDDSEAITTDIDVGGPDVRAAGGEGNDMLDGIGSDRLDGGPGSDVVRGGGSDDVIIDADSDPDAMDGGDGSDTLSFEGVSAPVIADLGAGTIESTGEPLRSFEDLIGGSGDDELRGLDGSKTFDNTIRGGGGDDLIDGRGGADYLYGGGGDDRVIGGPGGDSVSPGKGADRPRCGGGADTVVDAEAGEALGAHCERVLFGLRNAGQLDFELLPKQVRPGKLRFGMACPEFEEDDGEERACDIPVELREATGRERVLGTGHIHRRAGRQRFHTHVYLTPVGVRRAAKGVLATGRIDYRRGLAWTFTLKL